jgi:hypothetical protein
MPKQNNDQPVKPERPSDQTPPVAEETRDDPRRTRLATRLTRKERREIIESILVEHPDWSDRRIAIYYDAGDPKTVGAVRAKLEADGVIEKFARRLSLSGVMENVEENLMKRQVARRSAAESKAKGGTKKESPGPKPNADPRAAVFDVMFPHNAPHSFVREDPMTVVGDSRGVEHRPDYYPETLFALAVRLKVELDALSSRSKR